MLSDAELMSKITRACKDYYDLYGSYPERVGIHIDRLKGFRQSMRLHKPRPPLPTLSVAELGKVGDFPQITPEIHEVLFWPVAGKDMEVDEVYLPDPRSRAIAQPATRIAKMAKEFQEE